MPKRVESLVETLKQPANLIVKHFEIRHASTVLRAKILATAVALALKANDDLPEKGADFIASIKHHLDAPFVDKVQFRLDSSLFQPPGSSIHPPHWSCSDMEASIASALPVYESNKKEVANEVPEMKKNEWREPSVGRTRNSRSVCATSSRSFLQPLD
ncbi:hypothetical protein NC652_032270 [Populus alba x Populus x berolinensis]|nr:hypothetical protein NC652_032270 [Populus alba x Populus x berolinensis]